MKVFVTVVFFSIMSLGMACYAQQPAASDGRLLALTFSNMRDMHKIEH